MIKELKCKLGREEVIFGTGKMAKQASGAVTVQLGGTVVLSTCVSSKEAKEDVGFFPLFVEYQEKTYAAGKIPGGFFKREGRPSEKEILTARLTDRPIRPLFPDGMLNEVQIVSIVLSSDSENDSDILAVNAASAALCISDIPFDGPIGCVRVGLIDGKFVLNPTFKELEKSELDMVVAGKKDNVVMIESGSNELGEKTIADAIKFGQENLQCLIKAQEDLMSQCGKKKREDITVEKVNDTVYGKVKELAYKKLDEINLLPSKEEREDALNHLGKEIVSKLATQEGEITEKMVTLALRKVEKEAVRAFVLKGKRVDGRKQNEIRSIECNVGILPRTHGSGLFTRGQTQSLSVVTLGTSEDEQMIDALEGETTKTFMLHYNFPPFSVGEVKPLRGPGRREIGHGALAEKSLKPMMPSKDKFPYTVRIVSDILESNGSSSMATVCAGSLALMDAGVPIKDTVAGIAIGIVKEKDKAVLLTDIAGVEDHYGDMDFKIAGTKKGITAVQLDMKIPGLEMDLIEKAIKQSREARDAILDKMNAVISSPKQSVSDYAPKIVNFKINPAKIKDVIGPGGRIIKKIIQDTGVTINIEDDGSVQVASSDEASLNKAIDIVKGLTAEAEVGKTYTGHITRIMPFGAFCEILPGKEGLIHISELSDKFVKNVTDEVKVGDEVRVKVVEIDEQNRVNLSRKQVQQEEK